MTSLKWDTAKLDNMENKQVFFNWHEFYAKSYS